MGDAVLIDNDILIKASAFRISAELCACLGDRIGTPTVVGVVRFVVPSQIKRTRQVIDKEAALAQFQLMLATFNVVEPTEEELKLAAMFEEVAIERGVELDRGESQLLAILTERAERLLLTGDKRAIAAVEHIAPDLGLVFTERLACFEQLVRSLVDLHKPAELQLKICREGAADRALSICFGCTNEKALDITSLIEGLKSYIGAVRKSAPTVLIAGDKLSAMVT